MRTIVAVAIEYKGVLYSLPQPKRHHDVFRHISEVIDVSEVNDPKTKQGFLDSEGTFLNRVEALQVARDAFQLLRPWDIRGGQLYSEDVWLPNAPPGPHGLMFKEMSEAKDDDRAVDIVLSWMDQEMSAGRWDNIASALDAADMDRMGTPVEYTMLSYTKPASKESEAIAAARQRFYARSIQAHITMMTKGL